MKVYVYCQECGGKIYLDDIRQKRSDYPPTVRLKCSECGSTIQYHREELEAEHDGNTTAAGTVLGGAAGALAGPVGVAIGAGIGTVLGNSAEEEDKRRVEDFYERDPFFTK